MSNNQYIVVATNHDKQADNVLLARDDRKAAEYSANLMRQCGYQNIRIAISLGVYAIKNGKPVAYEVETAKGIEIWNA